MNWLFHLDDLSDDMDDRSTLAIGNEVMTTYYHPDVYNPVTHVGNLTKRFVPPRLVPANVSDSLLALQLLDTLHSRGLPRISEAIRTHHGPFLQSCHNPSS